MRIASWNVNSLRARSEQLCSWLIERKIDVALLQETKCGDAHFPFDRLAELGYLSAHHGVNHWNGVAILSRVGLDDVQRGFVAQRADEQLGEPRLIAATCGPVRCWSVYVPNGRSKEDPHFAYKLEWLDRLQAELEHVRATDRASLVAGDFNIGPADIDFYDPKRWKNKKHATPEERTALAGVVDLGLIDVARDRYPAEPMFTWWNYVGTQFAKDKGLRIDLALASEVVGAAVSEIWVDSEARDPVKLAPAKPSDHAPLIVDLDIDLGINSDSNCDLV